MSVRLKSGRSPVRSRPWPPRSLHRSGAFSSPRTRHSIHRSPGASAVYPQSRPVSEPIERIRHTIEVGVIEVRVGMRGDHDQRVAHRHLQQFHVGAGRSSQRRVGVSEVVQAHRRTPEFGDPTPPANCTLPVFEPESRTLRRHDRRLTGHTPLDPAFQDRRQPFRNRHATTTGAALRWSLKETARQLRDRPSHPNTPGLQVHIFDIESSQLSEPQSGIGQDQHHIALLNGSRVLARCGVAQLGQLRELAVVAAVIGRAPAGRPIITAWRRACSWRRAMPPETRRGCWRGN
jgi:hypothetical protein